MHKEMKRILTISALTLFPALALAQELSAEGQKVFTALNRITNLFYVLFLGVAVIMILFAAFKFLTAGGKPDNAETAKKMLLYTAIALALAMSARAFPALVRNAIGEQDGPTNIQEQSDEWMRRTDVPA